MATPNQRVGEYLLDSELGRGAFGEVWRARHHAWPARVVAVKLPADAGLVRVLQQEGLSMTALAHPNVAQALNFDPFADPPYLVFEYVPGSTLRRCIRAQGMPIHAADNRQIRAMTVNISPKAI